jgi:hypothetical protein
MSSWKILGQVGEKGTFSLTRLFRQLSGVRDDGGTSSSTAGRCGSLWLERLPLADLFGQLSLLALVRRLFPPAPKLFQPGFHKSGSPRSVFCFVPATVSHISDSFLILENVASGPRRLKRLRSRSIAESGTPSRVSAPSAARPSRERKPGCKTNPESETSDEKAE